MIPPNSVEYIQRENTLQFFFTLAEFETYPTTGKLAEANDMNDVNSNKSGSLEGTHHGSRFSFDGVVVVVVIVALGNRSHVFIVYSIHAPHPTIRSSYIVR